LEIAGAIPTFPPPRRLYIDISRKENPEAEFSLLQAHRSIRKCSYCVYDAFFKPARGLTEVGCMMHSRRYFFQALESDQQRMGKALHLIARLYSIEDRAKGLTGEERLGLRQRLSAPVMAKLHKYLLQIRDEVLPKSPPAKAVRYALNQWDALSRFVEDGDLEIDNGASERANRDIAKGYSLCTSFSNV
jgi:transposase